MITAVCDTGPLTHLWQIDLWAAFGVFHEIHLVEQVVQEVEQHVVLGRLKEFSTCTLHIHTISSAEIVVLTSRVPSTNSLQRADIATLALAQKLRPDFVLTDDLALRRLLENQQYTPMGSIGLVLHAYKHGLLSQETLHLAIDGLFVHSTLYLSPKFKAYIQKYVSTQISEK